MATSDRLRFFGRRTAILRASAGVKTFCLTMAFGGPFGGHSERSRSAGNQKHTVSLRSLSPEPHTPMHYRKTRPHRPDRFITRPIPRDESRSSLFGSV